MVRKQCSCMFTMTRRRPVKELKGFDKLSLAPGETKHAVFRLTAEDLSFYDESSGSWKAEPGTFQVLIGASSNDIRRNIQIRLK